MFIDLPNNNFVNINHIVSLNLWHEDNRSEVRFTLIEGMIVPFIFKTKEEAQEFYNRYTSFINSKCSFKTLP